jgi:hypothetical protein
VEENNNVNLESIVEDNLRALTFATRASNRVREAAKPILDRVLWHNSSRSDERQMVYELAAQPANLANVRFASFDCKTWINRHRWNHERCIGTLPQLHPQLRNIVDESNFALIQTGGHTPLEEASNLQSFVCCLPKCPGLLIFRYESQSTGTIFGILPIFWP